MAPKKTPKPALVLLRGKEQVGHRFPVGSEYVEVEAPPVLGLHDLHQDLVPAFLQIDRRLYLPR